MAAGRGEEVRYLTPSRQQVSSCCSKTQAQDTIFLSRVPSLRPIVGPIALPRSDPVVEIQRSTNPDPSSGGIFNNPE
ncbi:hypothetical protein F4813DRAFT_377684 [Daldinia decipiens]|uniref:uncharacterized protein n=1 Tax=Daldinia decipiens TaxID=326647 RepID=UPI0020C4F36D|nr:uncharacterized protein F4813DRAFT_377684 [Daldinia decipiens]KAI1652518.1 hypothetical protein F4813DRAFT_377684 [Daldinia decipiens]